LPCSTPPQSRLLQRLLSQTKNLKQYKKRSSGLI